MHDDIRVPKRSAIRVGKPPKDSEPYFTPPDAIANQEDIVDMSSKSVNVSESVNVHTNKTNLLAPLAAAKSWFDERSKKQKIIIVGGLALILILIAGGAVVTLRKPKSVPQAAPVVVQEEKKVEPPKPTTEASRLTGIQITPEFNMLPVTGVMIENSPDARPQSGLKDAGVVFEAVAEGGITRFLTLFQEAQPDYVGPVRSVRPYYLQWLQGFDAAVGHVGGSGEALAKIQNEGIKDLDQSFNGSAFQRVSTRYAPHNVYTSLGNLLALGKGKGYTSSTFTGFPRKVETPPKPPTANNINLEISSYLYNVTYNYVPATNTYNRVLAGKPHTDEKSGQQLSPKVVIAIVVAKRIHPDRVHTQYDVIGSGKAYIYQDGAATEGIWSKTSDKDQIKFLDAAGAPIALNPGQTWISAVDDTTDVTQTP